MIIEFGYSKASDKFFNKHEKIRDTFESNIVAVEKGNCNIDIKLLKGYKDLLRMRIGNYRVVYKVSNGEIIIIDVLQAGSRGDIYKKL